MWCKRILVAYDGSAAADLSLRRAIALADTCGAEIMAMHVVVGAPSAELADIYDQDMDIETNALTILNNFRGRQKFMMIAGMSPSYAILEQAEKTESDMIIMGSRGLTGIKEYLGSVSHAVVQHAKVPVMIVKEHCAV
ncbi:MAG: universal stress protein [Deferribacterales bacterium]